MATVEITTRTNPNELRDAVSAEDFTESQVVLGATPKMLVPYDGNRIAMIVGTTTPAVVPIWALKASTLTAGFGIQIPLNTQFQLNIHEHSGLVMQEQWMLSGGGALTVTVVEYFRRRKPSDIAATFGPFAAFGKPQGGRMMIPDDVWAARSANRPRFIGRFG